MSSLHGAIRDGRHYMQVRVYYEDTDFSGIVYYDSTAEIGGPLLGPVEDGLRWKFYTMSLT
jgi:hypothetical protein